MLLLEQYQMLNTILASSFFALPNCQSVDALCTLHHFSSSLIKHRLHVCLIVSHPRRGAIQKFKILTDQFSFLAFCILSSDFVVNAGMIWVTFEFDIFLYLHFVIDLALHTPGNIRNCKMLFDCLKYQMLS